MGGVAPLDVVASPFRTMDSALRYDGLDRRDALLDDHRITEVEVDP
jgi:hypothetical protein